MADYNCLIIRLCINADISRSLDQCSELMQFNIPPMYNIHHHAPLNAYTHGTLAFCSEGADRCVKIQILVNDPLSVKFLSQSLGLPSGSPAKLQA